MAPSLSRRRRQADSDAPPEDDYGSDASVAKRLRTNHDSPNTPRSSSSETEAIQNSQTHRRAAQSSKTNGSSSKAAGEHHPGAIVRVAVTNFVTYESAVFYPGPNLNMVIGPNGTGKSSLVCAIALGLGYQPKILGRAGAIGEYVKHGNSSASIEIELKCKMDEGTNHIVRVRITKDGDKRKWWINDSEATHKAVQALRESFGIQCDNLCQFLPQDRVAEFAALNPVDLLHHTQRAAAPPEMLAWHEELIRLRNDEKAIQLSHEEDRGRVTNLEERQENLRADVERLKERRSIQAKLELLAKTIPFVEYRVARGQFTTCKNRKKEAQKNMRKLEAEVEPTMQAVNNKQNYRDEISAVVHARKKEVQICERLADQALSTIRDVDERMNSLEQDRQAELDGDKSRRQDYQNIQAKIRQYEAKLQNAPPEFDSVKWNQGIRAKEHKIRDLDAQSREVESTYTERIRRGNEIKTNVNAIETEIRELDSHAGMQANKLKGSSRDTAAAWAWIQENKRLFDHEIFGPPLITCSVKDRRSVDAVESLVNKGVMHSITVQSNADLKKLNHHLLEVQGLVDVQFKVVTESLEHHRNSKRLKISREELQRMGFDGWADDFVDGPDPVVAMLCSAARLNRTAISLRDISGEEQFRMLERSGLDSYVAGGTSYTTMRRAEYGPGASSTSTKSIRAAHSWTDQPADSGEKRALTEKLHALKEEFDTMRTEVMEIKKTISDLTEQKKLTRRDMEELKEGKNEAQRIAGSYAALPKRIQYEETNLAAKKEAGLQVVQRLLEISVKQDDVALEKLTLSFAYRDQIAKLKEAHTGLLEAQLRLLEASSDYEVLQEHNGGIVQKLAVERQLVQDISQESDRAKEVAQKALAACQAIIQEEEEGSDYFSSIDESVTLESINEDMTAARAQLELAHGGNAGAIDEWQKREETLEKLKDKMRQNEEKLERMSGKITRVRKDWEPALDKLIKEISDAFADNFERIGCAGEVGIHKTEDFDQWSIQIKVKFREEEELQILNQHRQSGGERSVSTIFYLMSMQSLARAPFRVVDEINQGMDPRNERMVHGRMVDIACQEHTSQYFLITPKLLTNLAYSPLMKVLLINSGEFMPKDHARFSIDKVISSRRAMLAN